jgi:tetratricopeptide (TPR) repeat protein
VSIKKLPGEGKNQQSTDAPVTCPNPVLFPGERFVSSTDSERCAAEHVKSGAALRLRAHREPRDTKIESLRSCVAEFEAALRILCRYEPAAARVSTELDFTDLLIELTNGACLEDLDELEEATELLREACSHRLRDEDPVRWIIDMCTLGCAFTLLGKVDRAAGDIARLEEAVDTFNEVLNEPRLLDMPRQRVIVYINLADALCALAEATLAEGQVAYFESAVDSLAKALALVVPGALRHFAEAHPERCV